MLAAGLLAVLFVATLSPPGGVGAHPCDPDATTDMHEDFRATPVPCGEDGHQGTHRNIITVDGGRTSLLMLRVHPNPGSENQDLSLPEEIKIDLPGFVLTAESASEPTNYELKSSGDESPAKPPSNAEPGDNTITLTLDGSGIAVAADEHLIITIKKEAGIISPKLPQGFDNPEDGYPITIRIGQHVSEDENFVVVRNPISSTVPGAQVRVDLITDTKGPIGGNQEIEVDFSGPSPDSEFVLPPSIINTRITIRSPEISPSFSPSDVLVQGAKVLLTIPEDKRIPMGEFTISFSQTARVKNPVSAGTPTITVSTFIDPKLEDEITAVIRRTTTVSPSEGVRGTEFTLEGKGYAAGTVTIYNDLTKTGQIDPGETLASVNTVRGAFRVKLMARGEAAKHNDEGELEYTVKTKDSEGEDHQAGFRIRSSMSFEPSRVSIGSKLKITVVDWEDVHKDVVAVKIAGQVIIARQDRVARQGDIADQMRIPISVESYSNCYEFSDAVKPIGNRMVTLDVFVPSRVPPGEQTVALFDHDLLERVGTENGHADKACADLEEGKTGTPKIADWTFKLKEGEVPVVKATVEIEGRSLTLSPSEAVRGQRVTVSGFGFGRGGSIASVTINGEHVDERPGQFEVSTTGFISITVTVPPNTPVGTNEVRVTGADGTVGTGTLTVPEPAVTVSPSESRAGTEATVTGSGFIANTPVRVSYGDGGSLGSGDTHVAAGFADAGGKVSLPFRVPLSAQIGLSYQVTVQAEVGSTIASASATHSPALSTISRSPTEVSVGDLLTIRGQDLPPFAIVRPIEIDGRNVTPFPAPTTDETGAFEVEARVPGIPLGDQPLRVEVSGVVLTHTISIVPLPFSGPPARVFRDLVRSGVLMAVWRYDNATQDWDLYDPAVPEELSELNDLTHVQTGDIVWLETTTTEEFQGDLLNAGWSLISLK